MSTNTNTVAREIIQRVTYHCSTCAAPLLPFAACSQHPAAAVRTVPVEPHPGRVFVRNTQHKVWGQGLTLKQAMTELRRAAGKPGRNIKAEDCTIILHDALRIEVDDCTGTITSMRGGTFKATAYTLNAWVADTASCAERPEELVQLETLGGAQ